MGGRIPVLSRLRLLRRETIHSHAELLPDSGFLPKPFTPNDMAHLVREALDTV